MSVAEVFMRTSGGPELYVFETWEQARVLGFPRSGGHPLNEQARCAFGRPHIRDLMGRTLKRVVVAPGVDLSQDVGGEGSFRESLKRRQVTWGDQAEWFEF